MNVLDHPLWEALHGAHSGFAVQHGLVAAYQPDVAPFCALSPSGDPRTWDDLAAYAAGHDGQVGIAGLTQDPPAGWERVWAVPALQLVAPALGGTVASDPSIEVLTAADVPDMLDLVERTEPGPFRPRTVELGRYLGIRRHGKLVAMAGERMRPPGHTEVSAVCTDPAQRGQGLATRLIGAVVDGIRERGETPFLHVVETNAQAIRLYESLGFVVRRPVLFAGLRHLDLV